jgi:peroxiredoxin
MKKIFMALLAAVVFAGCNSGKDAGETNSKYMTDLSVGSQGVDFLFRDMAGKPFRLSENKGKVVLLYFWRMKCEQCKIELRAIDALQKKYKEKGLVVVAVGADSMHSAPLYEVHQFFDKEGFSFIKMRDEDGFVAEAYSVMRAPEVYVIGRDGTITIVQKGTADWSGPELTGAIEKLLSGGSK